MARRPVDRRRLGRFLALVEGGVLRHDASPRTRTPSVGRRGRVGFFLESTSEALMSRQAPGTIASSCPAARCISTSTKDRQLSQRNLIVPDDVLANVGGSGMGFRQTNSHGSCAPASRRAGKSLSGLWRHSLVSFEGASFSKAARSHGSGRRAAPVRRYRRTTSRFVPTDGRDRAKIEKPSMPAADESASSPGECVGQDEGAGELQPSGRPYST